MSDKSGWWGKSAKPLATSARRCENGHPMAMDWKDCPYCAAARNAGERTRVREDDYTGNAGATTAYDQGYTGGPRTTRINDPEPADNRAATGAARVHRPTMVDPLASAGGSMAPPPMGAGGGASAPAMSAAGGDYVRRETRVMDVMSEPSAPQAQRRPGHGRRLTGIVFTFTWIPLGQLFEVHEGRNFGGSGSISMEGNRDADILVTEDMTMSGAHFLILCQGGKYRISDCNSTNGTYVNGELVDAHGIELLDGALIAAGNTLFTFQKVLPPSTGAAAPAPARPHAAPEQQQPRRPQRDPDEDSSI